MRFHSWFPPPLSFPLFSISHFANSLTLNPRPRELKLCSLIVIQCVLYSWCANNYSKFLTGISSFNPQSTLEDNIETPPLQQTGQDFKVKITGSKPMKERDLTLKLKEQCPLSWSQDHLQGQGGHLLKNSYKFQFKLGSFNRSSPHCALSIWPNSLPALRNLVRPQGQACSKTAQEP